MEIQPYLYFNGRCDEAIEFYKNAIGAEVNFLMRFKEGPPEACAGGMVPPNWEEKVMHAEATFGKSTVMLSDGNSAEKIKYDGISLTILAKDEADAERIFHALEAGGQVIMPLGKTFFSPKFGMVADKFGVSWLVIVPQEM